MRVVIDTKVWIEFLIGQKVQRLKDLIFENQVRVYFSPELLSELSAVLYRPKFRKYFSKEQADEYIFLLLNKVIIVYPSMNFSDCKDEKDNFLLDLSYESKADFLITRDKGLLELNPFKDTKIIAPVEFDLLLKRLK